MTTTDPDRADAGRQRLDPTDWLAAMPDVIARLESARHPRVADVGCGPGFSTLALAHALLDAHVDGIDADPGSIAEARHHAADAGLDGRVRFIVADATQPTGRYDLVVILEALHQMTDPVGALAAARAALAPDGTVLVVDEHVAEAFRTVLGTATVRRLADQAGYARVDVLPADNDFFRLYRLDP